MTDDPTTDPTVISTDAVQAAAYYELTREHTITTGQVIRIHLARPHDTSGLRARAWVKVFDPAELAWKMLCEWESGAWVHQTPATLAPGTKPGDVLGGLADELYRRACAYLTSGLLFAEDVLNTDVNVDSRGYGLTRIHATPTGHVVRVRVWMPFESLRHTKRPIADAYVFDVDNLVWELLVSLDEVDWPWPATGVPEESILDRLGAPADRLYGLARTVLAHASGVALPDHADADAGEEVDENVDENVDEDDVGAVVHLLIRIGGYAAVHTLGSGSVEIYDDAGTWDYGQLCLDRFILSEAGEPNVDALADTVADMLATWIAQHPDRLAAANGSMTPTSHLVIRHGEFAAIGTPDENTIEIYPDVTAWNGGIAARHTVPVAAGKVLTPDMVSTAAVEWWRSTAGN